jgi:hypothetical protein
VNDATHPIFKQPFSDVKTRLILNIVMYAKYQLSKNYNLPRLKILVCRCMNPAVQQPVTKRNVLQNEEKDYRNAIRCKSCNQSRSTTKRTVNFFKVCCPNYYIFVLSKLTTSMLVNIFVIADSGKINLFTSYAEQNRTITAVNPANKLRSSLLCTYFK